MKYSEWKEQNKGDVLAYIKWCKAEGIVIDLSDADLRGADLRGADLRGAKLTFADFRDADLSEADLRGAQLTGAQLTGADLSDADLTGADLTFADLTRADLTRADLTFAKFTFADFRGADLSDADLSDADLRGAYGIAFIHVPHLSSRNDLLYAVLHEQNIMIKSGYWWGTIDEFISRVEGVYEAEPKRADLYVKAALFLVEGLRAEL